MVCRTIHRTGKAALRSEINHLLQQTIVEDAMTRATSVFRINNPEQLVHMALSPVMSDEGRRLAVMKWQMANRIF